MNDPTSTCWLDDDGRHVWWQHRCKGEEGPLWMQEMLPYPRWQAINGKVSPSIVCTTCGSHTSPDIGPSP